MLSSSKFCFVLLVNDVPKYNVSDWIHHPYALQRFILTIYLCKVVVLVLVFVFKESLRTNLKSWSWFWSVLGAQVLVFVLALDT